MQIDDISGTDFSTNTIDDNTSGTGFDVSNFIMPLMAVIVHSMSRVQCYLESHALNRNIQNTVRSPALLCEHDLLINLIHICHYRPMSLRAAKQQETVTSPPTENKFLFQGYLLSFHKHVRHHKDYNHGSTSHTLLCFQEAT